jgi:hypothetical protein
MEFADQVKKDPREVAKSADGAYIARAYGLIIAFWGQTDRTD